MKERKNHIIIFGTLSLGCIIFFLLDLALGSVHIPIKDVFKALTGGEIKESWLFILWQFRMPKAIMAVIAGAGLSVAGLMMQTLFRNPLAGPFVLGLSSGASLGVALFTMAGTTLVAFPALLGLGTVFSAIIGATAVMLLVLLVSFKIADTISLLIIGIMVAQITGSIVSILQYFSDPEAVQNFLLWTFGSLAGITWDQLLLMLPIIIPGLLGAFLLQKPLNALLMGENYARGIGIPVNRIRFLILIVTALLAGTMTAFAGPIAFIGVAVPHLTRAIFRTSDHSILFPGVFLTGTLLMLICDILSQLPGSNQTLPINSVSALFGAPVVIWVILKSRNVKASFS